MISFSVLSLSLSHSFFNSTIEMKDTRSETLKIQVVLLCLDEILVYKHFIHHPCSD